MLPPRPPFLEPGRLSLQGPARPPAGATAERLALSLALSLALVCLSWGWHLALVLSVQGCVRPSLLPTLHFGS